MRTWFKIRIDSEHDARKVFSYIDDASPQVFALDTETDGLHITRSKPFVFQFGWLNPMGNVGYAATIDLTQDPVLGDRVIRSFLKRARKAQTLVGHNIKFDLHMLLNLGYEYRTENITDTMFMIRYAHDSIAEKNGGAPMGLKAYATQYITRDAKDLDRKLQEERSSLAKGYNLDLKNRLAALTPPPELGKSWSVGALDQFFSDQVMDWTDLPQDAAQIYLHWRDSLPDLLRISTQGLVDSDSIPYTMLDRNILLDYSLMDIVLTLEVYESLIPVLTARDNWEGVRIENSLLLPLLDMERVGFAVDREYLRNAHNAMKNYILERRQDLAKLSQTPLKIGQHKLIHDLLNKHYGIEVNTTRDEELSRILADLRHADRNREAIAFIETLLELRTLEKWYSTYITRFERDLILDERLYTTIRQVGAVSGRVTSDFQQFPRKGVTTLAGDELFSPRRLVRTTGNEWCGIAYLDYSQIELRLQAMYTILIGHPEPNLCRAFMPFGCVSDTRGRFDPTDPEDIAAWQEDWRVESDGTAWKALDVHAATAYHAFGATPDSPNFKLYRDLAKTINFAKNYGAKFKRMKEMFPDKPDEEVRRIDEAYYKAFPNVKKYHDYCYRIADQQAAIPNLFGVKYYNVPGHNLINMLVQGSGAYLMKKKIREIWEYRQAHHIKTRFQMNIHDELSFEVHKDDDPQVLWEFKRIMEDWPDTLIPIVAEMDYTRTTWADKKKVHRKEDITCN